MDTRAAESSAAPAPAPVTLGRVQRYYALLCDVGLDRAFDAARESRQPEVPVGQPVSITEQVGTGREPPDVDAGTVRIDMGRVFRLVAREGLLVELGTILFDVDDRQAAELAAGEVEDALYPFALRSHVLIEMLLSFGSATP